MCVCLGQSDFSVAQATLFYLVYFVVDENMQAGGGQMLGSEAIKEIRAIEKELAMEPAVILSVSGNCLQDDKTKYMNSGADGLWRKPLPSAYHLFKDATDKWKSKKRSRRQSQSIRRQSQGQASIQTARSEPDV